MSSVFTLTGGKLPLLISVPHAGIRVPDSIARRFTPAARSLPDTDWHVDRLYAWAAHRGVSLICAHYSRYVIDLNRPPDDTALYAGKTTGLIPIETFGGDAIYAGENPGPSEIQERIEQYWRPYHTAIQAEMKRMVSEHGYGVLLDAHSIRSRVPLLFDDVLPDLNLGSFSGQSAARGLVDSAMATISGQREYSYVLDGRFKGGYITRHYGQPETGRHAIQLEMSQAIYMDEDSLQFEAGRAGRLQEFLQALVDGILTWEPGNG